MHLPSKGEFYKSMPARLNELCSYLIVFVLPDVKVGGLERCSGGRVDHAALEDLDFRKDLVLETAAAGTAPVHFQRWPVQGSEQEDD